MARESSFQAKLIKDLEKKFPGCMVLKNDAGYIQGIPDLLILHKDRWAMLECKRSSKEIHQPNQDYYVEKLDGMSFSRFIFPENRDEVLTELSEHFDENDELDRVYQK